MSTGFEDDAIPDYERKLQWAESHLIKLEALTAAFQVTRSFEVVDSVEGTGRRHRYRLAFTAKPSPDLPLIAGDFLYNVRASLDYLVGRLVPSQERSHVMFPIVDEPVWDIPYVEGENKKRTEMRRKWSVTTRRMRAEAVAVLQDLQPLKADSQYPLFHVLDLLNRLSNKDRHRQLSVHVWGLNDVRTVAWDEDGEIWIGDELAAFTGLKDGANIEVPGRMERVEVRGTPVVAIQMERDGRHVLVPDQFRAILIWAKDEAIARLSPYVHRPQRASH